MLFCINVVQRMLAAAQEKPTCLLWLMILIISFSVQLCAVFETAKVSVYVFCC